ncbi:zincin, partial [Macrolepiota fuliginosa MF-IS2]
IPALELAKAEEEFRNQRVVLSEGIGGGLNDAVVINLYMHVVATDETLEGGNVPDSQITSQVNVLNTDYRSMNIGFNLVNVTRTIDKAWFHAGPNSREQTEMKQGLRQGGPADLNVYSNHLGHKLLGYATFPKDVSNLVEDGVVVLHTSLPGGGEGRYDGGRTLTHEVGHWLGLYHTFQGGCEEPGDLVDDTPSEAYPGFGCPEERKSCPQSTGLDPIHNFMDYGDDSCMESFTPGQGMRIKAQIAIYR